MCPKAHSIHLGHDWPNNTVEGSAVVCFTHVIIARILCLFSHLRKLVDAKALEVLGLVESVDLRTMKMDNTRTKTRTPSISKKAETRVEF